MLNMYNRITKIKGNFMNNSRFMVVILAILMIFAVACSSYQTSAPAQTQAPAQPAAPAETKPAASSGNAVSVTIQGFKFNPADVTVKVGDTVVWTNQDSAPHTVESADGMLKSDELSKGDTYSWTAKKAGKHDYHCGIHPSMKGSVTVQ